MGDLGPEGLPQGIQAKKAPVVARDKLDLTQGSTPARHSGWGARIAGAVATAALMFGGDKATGSHVSNTVSETASNTIQAAEQILGTAPKVEHVIKANARFELKNIQENGIDKPFVIRTSPRADTIDNQLDAKKALMFANKQIQGNLILGGPWYAGAGEDASEWVHFKGLDEKGVERDYYVAGSFAREIENQTTQ